jgi:nucleotide-binding universal stress UspA family protein
MRSPTPDRTRRIVVAVDHSAESIHAAILAAQVVAERGELVFVHVLEVPLEFGLDVPPLPEEEPARRAAHQLLGRCEAVAHRYGVSSRRVLERRHAAGPAILEAAERHRADLVVIGGEQRVGRTGRLRVGTTAAYVLKHASCRVMALSAPAATVASATAKVA